jgi:hypothetical protein
MTWFGYHVSSSTSQGREQIEPGTERHTALGAQQARLLFAGA